MFELLLMPRPADGDMGGSSSLEQSQYHSMSCFHKIDHPLSASRSWDQNMKMVCLSIKRRGPGNWVGKGSGDDSAGFPSKNNFSAMRRVQISE